MRLPDADGFCVAAQLALQQADVIYIHNAEGAPVAVLVSTQTWRDPWPVKNRRPIENHDHIEPDMGEEVPWASNQDRDPASGRVGHSRPIATPGSNQDTKRDAED